MKYFLAFLLLFNIYSGFSQSDEKAVLNDVYEHFKFGQSIDYHKSFISLIPNTKSDYEYNLEQPKEIMGATIEKCVLSFKKEKLNIIGFYWKDEKENYSTILQELISDLGNTEDISNNKKILPTPDVDKHLWKLENVTIFFVRNNSKVYPPVDGCTLSLTLINTQ